MVLLESTCRYEHFFHFALAHLNLYGLVKDFWAVWLRVPESTAKSSNASKNRIRMPRLKDNKYILPRYIRTAIALRSTQIHFTSQVKKRSADLLGYAKSFMRNDSWLASLFRSWMCGASSHDHMFTLQVTFYLDHGGVYDVCRDFFTFSIVPSTMEI